MSRLRTPLIVLAFALALGTLLGGRPLLEPDEGRYAEIAREMARGDSWLVPHLNGVPHFQKPPLLYWLTAASFRAFGVNEWAARLPSALAAAGTLLLTWWMGRLLGSSRIGLAAAGVLLASLEFFVLARALTPDMLMTFFLTLAIACFIRRVALERAGTYSRAWDYGFFLAMGLGFLTKGPMALVVPLLAVIAWKGGERVLPAEQRSRPMPWVTGLLLTVTVAMSWFVVMSVRDRELFDYFVKYELVQRFASKTHGRSQPLLFFLPVLLAGSLPWLFSALGSLLNALARQRAGWRPSPTGWMLAGWVLGPLIILSLSGSKLFTYVLPLFPALALWIAGAGAWRDADPRASAKPLGMFWNAWWQRVCLVCALAFFASPGLAVAAISLTIDRWREFQLAPWFGLALGALVVAACVATWLATITLARKNSDRWRAFESAAPVSLAVLAVALWLLLFSQQERLNDRFGRQASTKPLAQLARAQPDYADAAIFSWRVRAHGFAFYLDRTVGAAKDDADVVLPMTPELSARILADDEALFTRFVGARRAYGLTRKGIFTEIFAPRGWKVLGTAGDFVLVTNAP